MIENRSFQRRLDVVRVRDVEKFYGSPVNPMMVLNKLNMTVMSGSIYAIIGASGCGKTTLLSSILGLDKINGGEITVLGEVVRHNEVIKVGKKIGYVPQETALINQFTIKETLLYFGNVFGVEKKVLNERYRFLKELLELPEDDKIVGNCSGGQKRRVSLGTALIHNPFLLILDEPTVGLDPILRVKIWNYMMKLTRTSDLAIIITTHYIEEARQADFCGLMRNGILLVEDTPDSVLQTYKVKTLEDAFLQLCILQEDEKSDKFDTTDEDKKELIPQNFDENRSCIEWRPSTNRKNFDIRIITTIMYKIFIQLVRQPAFTLSVLLIPGITLLSFIFATGGNPEGLRLGIVNDEIININECYNKSLVTAFPHDYQCDIRLASCRFIDEITSDVGEKIYFQKYEDAFREGKKGNLHAIIHISANYTQSVQKLLSTSDYENEEIEDAELLSREIQINMDQSNSQISLFIYQKLFDSFATYLKKLMKDCHVSEKIMSNPVKFEKPIYGNFNSNFKISMGAPMIVILIFFAASGLPLIIFDDRKEGFWNQTLLAGVRLSEVMISYIAVLSLFLIGHLIQAFACIYVLAPQDFNFTIVIIYMTILGFSGIWLGLAFSFHLNDLSQISTVSTASSLVFIVLSGIFWPLEGMPKVLYWLAISLPTTIPGIGLKDVIVKGAQITHPSVYIGLSASIFWTVILTLLTLRALRNQKFFKNNTSTF